MKRSKKPTPRLKTPRRQKFPKYEMPNPVVVAQLEKSASALADEVEQKVGRSSAAVLRDVLPASLLMMAAHEAGPVTLTLGSDPPVRVRPIDLQMAGMATFAKMMMRLSSEMAEQAMNNGFRLARGEEPEQMIVLEWAPPTPDVSRGDGSGAKRRRPRKSTPKKR